MIDHDAVARAVSPEVGKIAKQIAADARQGAAMSQLRSGPDAYGAVDNGDGTWTVGTSNSFAHLDEWAHGDTRSVPTYALSRAAAAAGKFTPE